MSYMEVLNDNTRFRMHERPFMALAKMLPEFSEQFQICSGCTF